MPGRCRASGGYGGPCRGPPSEKLSDLGGAASVALVRIGYALGLYKTLHERGPMTVGELATAAGVNQRYLREWLSHQAASNYLSYDPSTGKFALPE